MLGILAGTDQQDSYALFPGKAVIACDSAPRAVFSSLVGRPRVLGILAGMEQKDSCPRRTGYWFLWEMTSVGFCIQRSAWFDSGYMRCVSLRGFWKNFGVVQTVQKTVKVPHAFLDMAVDKCRMVETVQILWSLRSWCCPPLSLLMAVSAAAIASLRPWTTSNSGDGDLAASSFSVSCVLGSVAQGFEP